MKICDSSDCGNPVYDDTECSECGDDLCEDCVEECDYCKQEFCTTCLDDHLGDGCDKEPPSKDEE